MKARLLPWAVLLLVSFAGGCVERRFVITSDPPGAVVLDEKNIPIGATPVDKPFIYNGKYRFTLVKDGYQTLVVEENIRPRWYQYFPLDFISENLIPFTFRDVRRLGGDTGYPMQPIQILPPEPVLQEAVKLRGRGLLIGAQPGETVPEAIIPVTAPIPVPTTIPPASPSTIRTIPPAP